MKQEKLLDYLVKEKKVNRRYTDIIDIYPHKINNELTLNLLLQELKSDYDLIRITDDLIRAFKK